jgi:hypothetical protein
MVSAEAAALRPVTPLVEDADLKGVARYNMPRTREQLLVWNSDW